MDVYAYVVDWGHLDDIVAAVKGDFWGAVDEGEGNWCREAESADLCDSLVFHAQAAHAYVGIEHRLPQPLRDRLGDFVVAFAGQMMPGRTEPNDLPDIPPGELCVCGLSPTSVTKYKKLVDGLDIETAIEMLREDDDQQADDFAQFIGMWRDVVFRADELGWGILIVSC